MRMIDGDVLYEQTAEWENRALNAVMKTKNDEDKTEWQKWSTILAERSAFKFDVADAPTVDAEPVVRCRDCKWHKTPYCKMDVWHKDVTIFNARESDFCSYGERKGGVNDE